MIFASILLLVAMALASIVAYATVFGFMAIFAGSPYFAFAMGVTIETAKLVGISYLYRQWDKITKASRYAILVLTTLAILLSAIGFFGFLSKSHIENGSPIVNNESRIEYVDKQLALNTSNITSAEIEIKAFNAEITKLIEFDKVSGSTGSKATREGQQARRDELNTIISESQEINLTLEEEKFNLQQTINDYDSEIGILRYIAEILWDADNTSGTDKAVRLLIILLMLLFDPYAIVLLMGANNLLLGKKEKENDDSSGFELEDLIDENISSDEIEEENIQEPEEAVEEVPEKPKHFLGWTAEEIEANEKLRHEEIEEEKRIREEERNHRKESDDKMDVLLDTVIGMSEQIAEVQEETEAEKQKQQILDDIRKG